jgi:hypothetical protein
MTKTENAYWLNGTAYCAACTECEESPCMGDEERARAIRKPGVGRCGCCGEAFAAGVDGRPATEEEELMGAAVGWDGRLRGADGRFYAV